MKKIREMYNYYDFLRDIFTFEESYFEFQNCCKNRD